MSVPRKRRAPSLVHHRPTGQARVRIGGRDFDLGKHGSPEAEAVYHRLLAGWRETGVVPPTAKAAKATPDPDGVTVAEMILAFWRHAEAFYVTPDGDPAAEQHSYKSALRVLRKVAGPNPAAEFGPERLPAVRAAMAEAGRTRKYVDRSLGRVRHVFTRLEVGGVPGDGPGGGRHRPADGGPAADRQDARPGGRRAARGPPRRTSRR